MRFSFELGETEKHLVEYNFNQLLGRVVIRVNHQEVKRKVRLFSEPIREVHRVDVGENERFSVLIEKQRKRLYGQRCNVFLNDRLFRVYDGV